MARLRASVTSQVKGRPLVSSKSEALRQTQEELVREKRRQDDRSAAFEVALRARDAQIGELERQAQEHQKTLKTSQEALEKAHLEATRLRQMVEAERARSQAKDTEHQGERSRLQERAQAQERRLNTEVDRTRQEVKRLEQQLDIEVKKGARALAEAIERERNLDQELGLQKTASTTLARDLASARGELSTLQSQASDQAREMLNILSELRNRLPASADDQGANQQRTRRKRNGLR